MNKIKLAIPKGRLYSEVVRLIEDAGLKLAKNGRNYRPKFSDSEIEIKILKPQNIPKLVELGSQDLAFSGYDSVIEQKAEVKELIDLKFNSVKIVLAGCESKNYEQLKKKKIKVASEYEFISKRFLESENFDYEFIKSYGATEVFIPEDADMIIDNLSTGNTMKANNLQIYKEIMASSTRLIANRESMKSEWKSKKIMDFLMLIKSVLEGRKKTLVELNVSEENLQKLISVMPSMKAPTIAKLFASQGYAVRGVVEKNMIANLIPILKENGATDILVFDLRKVIP